MLRAGSKLTSNQYCMLVLGLLFLRYAYIRFKLVEKEVLANRPIRNGRVIPLDVNDFKHCYCLAYDYNDVDYDIFIEALHAVFAECQYEDYYKK